MYVIIAVMLISIPQFARTEANNLIEAQTALDAAEAELEGAQATSNEMKVELDKAQEACDAAKKKLVDAQAASDSATEELHAAQAAVDSAKADLIAVQVATCDTACTLHEVKATVCGTADEPVIQSELESQFPSSTVMINSVNTTSTECQRRRRGLLQGAPATNLGIQIIDTPSAGHITNDQSKAICQAVNGVDCTVTSTVSNGRTTTTKERDANGNIKRETITKKDANNAVISKTDTFHNNDDTKVINEILYNADGSSTVKVYDVDNDGNKKLREETRKDSDHIDQSDDDDDEEDDDVDYWFIFGMGLLGFAVCCCLLLLCAWIATRVREHFGKGSNCGDRNYGDRDCGDRNRGACVEVVRSNPVCCNPSEVPWDLSPREINAEHWTRRAMKYNPGCDDV